MGGMGEFNREAEDHLVLKCICLQSPEWLRCHSMIWPPLPLPHAKLKLLPVTGKWGPLPSSFCHPARPSGQWPRSQLLSRRKDPNDVSVSWDGASDGSLVTVLPSGNN